MERPKIKDKAALAYIEDLERQLDNFKADSTIARMYLGVKKQADDMAALLSSDIEVQMEDGSIEMKPILDVQSLSSKDDKFFDRYNNILKIWRPMTKDLKEGEGVWHKESGDGYIIDKVGKDSAIAVKTIKIVDSSGWVVVKK